MKKTRKAFTLVELLVVIAILAVLATVGIVGYTSFTKKAKESNDRSVISQLNLALQATETSDGKPKTMYEALKVVEGAGFVVANLTPDSDHYDYIYDMENNRFALINQGGATVAEATDKSLTSTAVNKWLIAHNEADLTRRTGFSVYLADNYNGTKTFTNLKTGLDCGNLTDVSSITYTGGASAQEVVIRTNGGLLTVNAPQDSINHFGQCESVNIIAVASASYHENGSVPFIQISKGRIEIEATGDVNGIHIANVQTVASNGDITKTDNQFSGDIILSLNGNDDVKISRDTIGTDIDSAVLVCQVEGTTGSNEFIWLVGDGTIENAKVYVTSSNSAPDTSAPSTTTTDNASAAAIAIANNAVNTGTPESPVYTATDSGTSAETAQVASLLKGSGTENDPYLVYDFDTIQKISEFYDKGYNYFAVDTTKVENGKIDCTGWTPVYLHGSFNGNNVKFTNVTSVFFQTVGYKLENENIVLKDFEATMNVSSNGQYGAAALVKNIFNSGKTTFDNVSVHGYLEGFWNMGSYFNYGTANYDDKGSDYEVEFNNCVSDATLVCASGNTIGGLFGHSYEGKNNSFTLRVNNSEYTGKMFLTTSNGKGNKYFGMTSDYNNAKNHFYFDGVEDTFNNGDSKNAGAYSNSTKISNVVATKDGNGYSIAKQANVAKIVVTITAQLTAYDSNNVQIANLSGITMTLSSYEITDFSSNNVQVMGLFSAINIINNAGKYSADLANSQLVIQIAGSENYKSGVIRIQVNQYDSTGSIVSAGTTDIASNASATSAWTIK